MMTPISLGGLFATQSSQNKVVKTKQPVTTVSQTHTAFSAKPDQFVHTSGRTTQTSPRFSGHLNQYGEYIHSNGDVCESDCDNARDARRAARGSKRKSKSRDGGGGMLNTLGRVASTGLEYADRGTTALGGAIVDGAGHVAGEAVEDLASMSGEYKDLVKHLHITTIARVCGLEQGEEETDLQFAARTLQIARRPTPDQEKRWEEAEDTAIKKAIAENREARKALPLYQVAEILKLRLEKALHAPQNLASAASYAKERREKDFRDNPVVSSHRRRYKRRQAEAREAEREFQQPEPQRSHPTHSRRVAERDYYQDQHYEDDEPYDEDQYNFHRR